MTTFIIITVLVALFFLFVITKGKKKEETKENSVSMPYVDVSVSTEPDENETYNEPIKQVSDGWVINPGCPFELTVINCDLETASLVRDLCNKNDSQARHELLAMFATNNIRVKEIEAYKHKYASIYYQRIEELRATSKEYNEADPKDRADMEEEFKITAQDYL